MEYRNELLPFLQHRQEITTDSSSYKANGETDAEEFERLKPQFLIIADDLPKKTSGRAGVLLVYRTGCPACERFKTEFLKLVQSVEQWNNSQRQLEGEISSSRKPNKTGTTVYSPVFVYAMETVDPRNMQFITNKNIDAVPTIFLMSASGKMEKYQGPRDAPTLLQQLAARRVIKTMY